MVFEMNLELKELCCDYGKKMVIFDVSLSVGTGKILCLLGPNGVGKTTFFKTILVFLKLLPVCHSVKTRPGNCRCGAGNFEYRLFTG
jgi:ABC-type Mn2+/Zn2+ transport system ATPase subunit